MQSDTYNIGIHRNTNLFSAQLSHSNTVPKFRFHFHEYYEFYIFLKGKIMICFEDIMFETSSNQLYIFPPNCLHGLVSMDDHCEYERMFFHVTPDFLGKLSVSNYSILHIIEEAVHNMHLLFQLTDEQVVHLISIIEQINELSAQSDMPSFEFRRRLLLTDALLTISEAINSQKNTPTASQYHRHPFLPLVLNYISDHFTEDLTLQKIAEVVNVSKYHLSHEFSKETGDTLMHHLLTRRLQYSLMLLKEGHAPVNACFEAGFSTYSNFQKAFRAYYGVSPRNFSQLLSNRVYDGSTRTITAK